MKRHLRLFDLDGTLIESYLELVECPRCGGSTRDLDDPSNDCAQCRGKGHWLKLKENGYDQVDWLPGRLERLRELVSDESLAVGIVTNQTGVHYGYQTADEVIAKLHKVLCDVLETPALDDLTAWAALEPGFDRKPNPGMLMKAMLHFEIPAMRTIFIGDMQTDQEAAAAAGCGFNWAADYFK